MNYLIEDEIISTDDGSFQDVVSEAHKRKVRPRCMCHHTGVEMYICVRNDLAFIKRMPGTGQHHAPSCQSYEAPPEISGIGELLGTAIREDTETGSVALRLDFSLTRRTGKAPPEPSGAEPGSAVAPTNKLTMRSLLHYLWDSSSLNKHESTVRRTWSAVRRSILASATQASSKGGTLDGHLYVPETFRLDDKDEIAERRLKELQPLTLSGRPSTTLKILIGELKEFVPTRFGHRAVIKHLPDTAFFLSQKLHSRVVKLFAQEIDLWGVSTENHLILAASFGISASGLFELQEVALMVVTKSWIPFESSHEATLIDALVGDNRSFTKSLRFNLSSEKPIASVVLHDVEEPGSAMYLMGSEEPDSVTSEREELIAGSDLNTWLWPVDIIGLPQLPARRTS